MLFVVVCGWRSSFFISRWET